MKSWRISRFEDAYRGTEVELNLSVPEPDEQGRMRRVPRTFKVRIPRRRRRAAPAHAGRGGKGFERRPGRRPLYHIALHRIRCFRVSGHDLYLDLPLAPWESGARRHGGGADTGWRRAIKGPAQYACRATAAPVAARTA